MDVPPRINWTRLICLIARAKSGNQSRTSERLRVSRVLLVPGGNTSRARDNVILSSKFLRHISGQSVASSESRSAPPTTIKSRFTQIDAFSSHLPPPLLPRPSVIHLVRGAVSHSKLQGAQRDHRRRTIVAMRNGPGFLPDASIYYTTLSVPRMDRASTRLKRPRLTFVSFIARCIMKRRKEGGREARKEMSGAAERGRREGRMGKRAREFLASVPRPTSAHVCRPGCALHGAQCNGRRYGRVAS